MINTLVQTKNWHRGQFLQVLKSFRKYNFPRFHNVTESEILTKEIKGGTYRGDHLAITYGGELLYLWIF